MAVKENFMQGMKKMSVRTGGGVDGRGKYMGE